MIVCLRTVEVPAAVRRQLARLDRRRACDPSGPWHRGRAGVRAVLGDGETVVVTVWPDHATFDAWIATPERDALTASEVHQAVDYRPITRYDVVGGYLNLPGLQQADSTPEEDP